MIDFTQNMLYTIDDYASKTNANLKDLSVHENQLQQISASLEDQQNNILAQRIHEIAEL